MKGEIMDKKYMLDIIESECMREDTCPVDNCQKCNEIEECYTKAVIVSNQTFAESIDYGGYDSEEEFWDNLLG